MSAKYTDVAGYLATVPDTHRPALETLYRQITTLYPDVTEHIRWSQPLFKVDGQTLCAFKAYKHHSSLGIWSDTAFSRIVDELAGYDIAESTIRFTPDAPLPDDVVAAILNERVKEIRRTNAE
jgi:uncharacterized protein YdhG (YjbR/CyaY superfamily)